LKLIKDPPVANLPCSVREACGGCPLGDRQVDAQRAVKAERIRKRLGQLDEMVGSPRPTGYRARVALGVHQGRVGYRRGRSHQIVPVTSCPVARPEVSARMAELSALDLDGVQRVQLRSDGTRVVTLFDNKPEEGPGELALEVHGTRFRVSASTFYQVNLEANELLVAEVQGAVRRLQPERLLDLFAGLGNLTLGLAREGVPVTLVESSRQALADAQATADAHGVSIATRVADAQRWQLGDDAFDVVVLDPPRAGAKGLLARLVRQRPRGIVYVSCGLDGLARDLREATRAGYRVQRVVGFDLFPFTQHVETLVVLAR